MLNSVRPLTMTCNAGGHMFFLSSTNVPWMVVGGTSNSVTTFEGVADVTVDGVTTSRPFHAEATDGSLLTPIGEYHLKLVVHTDSSKSTALYRVNDYLSKGKINLK